MRLQLPDGSWLDVPAQGLTMGRGSPPCWADPSISRQQLQLTPLPDLPGVLKLRNLGINAVLVETCANPGAEWELREVVDQGQDTLLDARSRFYLISRLDTTLITLHPPAATTARPSGAASPAAVDSGSDLQAHSDPPVDAGERPLKRPRHDAAGQAGQQVAAGQAQQAARRDLGAPFQLLAVRGLKAETAACGAAGVRLREVVEAGVTLAVVSNFMVDLPWLLSACPALLGAGEVVLVHGEHGEREAALRAAASNAGIAGFTAHRPPLPIAWGTHHSKAFLLLYPAGLRIVVHTANLIHPDCNNKTQGLWHQDFPPKTPASPPTSDFEAALADYLTALSLPVACARRVLEAVRRHDFSGASACLVPSVPGYHTGAALQRYGHMRVRALLAQEELAAEWRAAPVVVQCSSLGSLDESWLLAEFGGSLAAGKYPAADASAGSQPGALPVGAQVPRLAANQLQIVWTTVEEVRGSVEGWAAGKSIPGPQKNVGKPFLQRHWHRFGGHPVGRSRAMPHIKTYARYIGERVAWVLLTSHNLSKAAWGQLQKGQRQLMVRSYELGVLLLPSRAAAAAAHPSHGFSCTAPSAAGAAEGAGLPAGTTDGRAASKVEFVAWGHARGAAAVATASTSSAAGGTSQVEVPLPFQLPPVKYTGADRPWMCDVDFPGLDALGRPCGAPWPFYGLLDSDDDDDA